jgi:GT2 family glycosyltransferase
MISIITSVHNQLGMNKLFYETLKKNSSLPFELIVIDNDSTDGSREYFEIKADVLIPNAVNYSYPHCQNQGIKVAKYNFLAFFNNDIIVSRGWDKKIVKIMDEKDIEVISFATNDHLESKELQRRMHKRWKRIKFLTPIFYGINSKSLQKMIKWMYGDFDKFCNERFEKFKDKVIEGFSGSCIIMKRSAFDKVGTWDERLQVADFDLYFRTKERNMIYHDIQPMQLALGVYIHHFQRLTLRSKNPIPFADQSNFISLKEKWGEKTGTLYKDVIG